MQEGPSKVQAALGRAEEVAETKQVAVWAAREAADKALEHMASLRQGTAEFTERIHSEADAHVAEDQWGFGERHEAGGSWSSWQWDQPGDGVQTQRILGERRQPLGWKWRISGVHCSVCSKDRPMSKQASCGAWLRR